MRLILAMLLFSAPAWADVSPTASTGSAAPESVSSIAQAWGHSGFVYAFSASSWSLFNASPLGYTPFEFGYDFGGLRIQSGIDLVYYEGKDTDEKRREAGLQRYSYEISDWRTSLLYRPDIESRLRPVVGISLNMVGGSRRLTPDFQGGKDINADAKKIPAWSYIGLGGELGLEYLMTADWALHLGARYDLTFNTVPSPVVATLGFAVTF